MHFRSRDLRGSFLLVESKNGELLIGVIHNASTLFTILSLSLIERSFIIFVMKFRSMTLCWKERHEGWNIYVDICMDLLKIVKYIWYLITLVCLLDLCIRELVHEFKKAAARHMMCLVYILMGFVIDHIHPSPASCAKVPKKWTFYTRKLPPPS